MKLAFMTFSCPELDWSAVLKTAKDNGYHGVEPRLASKHGHGIEVTLAPDQRKAIRDQAAKAGVAIACLATSRKFVGIPSLEAEIEAGHAEIDLAGDLGCKRLRVFGGELPKDPAMTREAAVDSVSKGLSALADHAAERGVTLCMETHDGWCDANNCALVMKRCSHPAVAVNWDFMHTLRAASQQPEESYAILKPWIKHVHVHDGPGTGKLAIYPIGTGDIDHVVPLRLLKRDGYDGFLSGEWILGTMTPEFVAEHLSREAKTLRALLEEVA